MLFVIQTTKIKRR